MRTLGVTVLRLFSQVATVVAVSFVITADVGGWWGSEREGADWGREGGGGDTETRRAAEEPSPERKREGATLPVVAAVEEDTDDVWKRLGWGARGDCDRRWLEACCKIEDTADEESGGGAC